MSFGTTFTYDGIRQRETEVKRQSDREEEGNITHSLTRGLSTGAHGLWLILATVFRTARAFVSVRITIFCYTSQPFSPVSNHLSGMVVVSSS